jgi:hypothetical protein
MCTPVLSLGLVDFTFIVKADNALTTNKMEQLSFCCTQNLIDKLNRNHNRENGIEVNG